VYVRMCVRARESERERNCYDRLGFEWK